MNFTVKIALVVFLVSVAGSYLMPGLVEKLNAPTTSPTVRSPSLKSERTTSQRQIAAAQSTSENHVPQRAVKIPVGRNGHFYLDAQINGTRIPFLVDTGASFIALSYEHARKIGLRPSKSDFKYGFNTANGRAYAAKTTLDFIRYETIRLHNVTAFIMPKGALAGRSLLGNSFLSRLKEFKISNNQLILVP